MKKLIAMILTALSVNAFSTDPKTAYDMAQKGEAVIVDVREEDEIKSGMINNAKWFPLSKITNGKTWKEDFKQLVGDKTIFLHCRSGARSGRVMNILKENGIISENLGGYETLKKILPVKEMGVR
jgi:rhodanese-related sulfurtransferase